MKCPQCGFENASVARFCEKCGMSLRPKPKKKKWKGLLLLAAVVVIAAGAALWLMVLRPNEKSYDAILEEAQRYVSEMDYSEAKTLYLEAIEIEPSRLDAYLSLAQIYVEQKDYAQALSILNQAQDQVPSDQQEDLESQIAAVEEMVSPDLFSEVAGTYVFSSGAGAWDTTIELAVDGTFTGSYHDANMGLTGTTYPNGTVSICNFSGRFVDPIQQDEHSYTLTLDQLDTEGERFESYIEDGVRYEVTIPYGLEEGKEWTLYLEGAAMADLPDAFVSWMYASADPNTLETLPFNGLYNPTTSAGFMAYASEG